MRIILISVLILLTSCSRDIDVKYEFYGKSDLFKIKYQDVDKVTVTKVIATNYYGYGYHIKTSDILYRELYMQNLTTNGDIGIKIYVNGEHDRTIESDGYYSVIDTVFTDGL